MSFSTIASDGVFANGQKVKTKEELEKEAQEAKKAEKRSRIERINEEVRLSLRQQFGWGSTVTVRENDYEYGDFTKISSVQGVSVNLVLETSRGGFYSDRNRRCPLIHLEISFKRVSHYPQKKDGTFNYAGIARKIHEEVSAQLAQQQRERESKSLEAQTRETFLTLLENFGKTPVSQYSDTEVVEGVRVSYTKGGYLNLSLSISTYDRAEATRMLTALIAAKKQLS